MRPAALPSSLRLRRPAAASLDLFLKVLLVALPLIFVLWPFAAVFGEGLKGMSEGELAAFWLRSLRLVRNSLLLAFLVTLLTSLLSLSVAISYYFAEKKRRQFMQAILLFSLISPPFVGALSYINLFGRNGLITHRLLGLSLMPYGLWGIVFMQSFSFLALSALLLVSRIQNTEQSLIDSARSLGGKTRHLILDVLLPQLRPALFLVLILSFIRSLSDFTTPAIIGGRFNVLASEAYLAFIAQGDLKRATLMNLLLFLPALIAFFFYIRAQKVLAGVSHGLAAPSRPNSGSGLLLAAFRLLSLLFFAWILLQHASILMQAFGRYRLGRYYLTLANWSEARPYIAGSLLRSIVYSLVSALACTLLGFLMAFYLYLRKTRWLRLFDLIASMPYIVPGTFFGIGYILAFRQPPLLLRGTAAVVILNMIFKQLPFAGKVSSAAAAVIDPALPQVTQDLGGHPLRAFTDVFLPLSLPSLLLCFFQSFSSGMTTLGSIIFLVHPSRKLATLVLFDVIQSGKYGIASVIAVSITLICVAVNLLSWFLSGGHHVSEA